VWPGWRASGDRRESRAQAATHRAASCSPAGAQPDTERPATLRIRVALPHPRTHPKGRHRLPPLDAAGVSSGLCASQIPPAVLVNAVPEEARTERARRDTHPGHRRAQVAQSSVRLSTDCAHHLADVRDRHRQERGVPRAGQTLSPCSGRNRTLVVVVHRTRAYASNGSTPPSPESRTAARTATRFSASSSGVDSPSRPTASTTERTSITFTPNRCITPSGNPTAAIAARCPHGPPTSA
jgi:hypothetical protein